MITLPVIYYPDVPEVSQTKRDTCDGDDDGIHIMLSYNCDSRDLVLRIRDRLKEDGYKLWVDVDDMSE